MLETVSLYSTFLQQRDQSRDVTFLTCLITCAVQVPSGSGTPASKGHTGPGTPSSGQLGTPASGGWKTPSGSVGRVPVFGRVSPVQEPGSVTPNELQNAVTPSKLMSRSGRNSDDSVVFPDDDVCLSQAQPSSAPLACGGLENKATDVIPETMPANELAWEEAFPGEVTVKDVAPVVETMSDDDDSAGPEDPDEAQAGNAGGEDSEDDGMEDTDHAPTLIQKGEVVSKRVEQQVSPEQCGRRRQASLRNTFCPSPASSPAAPVEVGLPSRVRKGAVGRGRSGQGAGRDEKILNMKPLTQIGMQEKFKPPAAVPDSGKGRGRGGKTVKRKRDVNSQ